MDLMQKLALSKAIMDKHNEIPRGQNQVNTESVRVQDFNTPEAKYNIPGNLLSEQPIENTKRVGTPSSDAIVKSKLPDAIKKLMIENPIQSPQQPSPVLSDELVEKASRLMNKPEKIQNIQKSQTVQSSLDMNQIAVIIKQAVNEALTEKGLIYENEEKSNDLFSFRVGSHVFEGKITKVKKVK
jgi:hypothetical protein